MQTQKRKLKSLQWLCKTFPERYRKYCMSMIAKLPKYQKELFYLGERDNTCTIHLEEVVHDFISMKTLKERCMFILYRFTRNEYNLARYLLILSTLKLKIPWKQIFAVIDENIERDRKELIKINEKINRIRSEKVTYGSEYSKMLTDDLNMRIESFRQDQIIKKKVMEQQKLVGTDAFQEMSFLNDNLFYQRVKCEKMRLYNIKKFRDFTVSKVMFYRKGTNRGLFSLIMKNEELYRFSEEYYYLITYVEPLFDNEESTYILDYFKIERCNLFVDAMAIFENLLMTNFDSLEQMEEWFINNEIASFEYDQDNNRYLVVRSGELSSSLNVFMKWRLRERILQVTQYNKFDSQLKNDLSGPYLAKFVSFVSNNDQIKNAGFFKFKIKIKKCDDQKDQEDQIAFIL